MDFGEEHDTLASPSARRPRHSAQVPDELAEDIVRRMAAMRVRHQVDQHACRARETGSCAHPNHRRDIDYMHEMLGTLGLDADYPTYTDDEQHTLLRWLGNPGQAAEQAA